MVLADGSLWVRPPRLIHLMMNLALGRPALSVVAGALASLIFPMRTIPMTNSTRRHFSALSGPPISLCSSSLARFLKAKDETISGLQQQTKTSENKRLTQEAIRNYEDTGRSGFHFHLDDVSDMLGTFVIPHIRDLEDQKYFKKLAIATAKAEDLSSAISMVT